MSSISSPISCTRLQMCPAMEHFVSFRFARFSHKASYTRTRHVPQAIYNPLALWQVSLFHSPLSQNPNNCFFRSIAPSNCSHMFKGKLWVRYCMWKTVAGPPIAQYIRRFDANNSVSILSASSANFQVIPVDGVELDGDHLYGKGDWIGRIPELSFRCLAPAR